jgi:hypothetical protein
MLFFLKLNNRNCGKMLTVTPVQNSVDGQFENSSTFNHGKSRRDVMKKNRKGFLVIVGIGLALMMPICTALAESLDRLSAEWWQWALSIPTSVNPQIDPTGQNAVVGQRGSVWFLAGVFFGGTATRTFSVPEGTQLFVPVINSVQINTPNVCGQIGTLSVKELRASAAAFIDGATNLSVTVEGVPIKNLQRVRSRIFVVALPVDNIFNSPCGGPGTVPPGIYSPAVDDGFYVLLDPLPLGHHALHFHSENPSQNFMEDVTYNLTVVPVSLK